MGIEAQVIENAQAIAKMLSDAKNINGLTPIGTPLLATDEIAFYVPNSGSTLKGTIADLLLLTETNDGLYRIGDWLVDRRGGTNTEIKTGDICYGIHSSLFSSGFVIVKALVDSPTTELEFTVLFSFNSLNEWNTSTGTRLGGDLEVILGDYDTSGNGTKIIIDDILSTIDLTTGTVSTETVKVLGNNGIQLNNTADTFTTIITNSEQTATWGLKIPILTANSVFALTSDIIDAIPYTGASKPISLNSQNVTGVGILSATQISASVKVSVTGSTPTVLIADATGVQIATSTTSLFSRVDYFGISKRDASDVLRTIRFNFSLITGAATRDLTVQDKDGTIAFVGAVKNNTGTTKTLDLTDANEIVTMNNASANTLTIPANSSVAFPIGTVITLINLGAGTTTVGITTDTLNKSSAISAFTLLQNGKRTITKVTATRWIFGY
jgi:hypothetical protein